MFEEKIEKLNMTEQEAFKRIVNWLLAHTYLLQGCYVFEDHMKRTNQDYLFVERNFELFQEYLGYAGFRLERDNNYGVICLASAYESNRVRLDKLTTLMLYVLRLIYEEEREKLSISSDIFATTGDPMSLSLESSAKSLYRKWYRALFNIFSNIITGQSNYRAAGKRNQGSVRVGTV